MKEIVLSQKIERDELLGGRYVQREGLKSARESLQGNLIKVIIGPRRAGKSVFSMGIQGDVAHNIHKYICGKLKS
jgi:hypothetical protein